MEKINYLFGYDNLKIYQHDDMFKFSIDSILLPNFVTLLNKSKKILDIGTGNAVIPLILSTKINCQIDGVEIQKKSFLLAKKTVELNNLNKQINLINDDIKNYSKKIETDFYDTITCNPPFFKISDTSKKNKLEEKSLARHEINLNLDDIMKIAKKVLKNNGNIAIVHRTERLIDIVDTMKKNNIEPKKIQFVYSNKSKPSNILLIEGTKNGKPGCKILPPLYIHNEDGSYTNQLYEYIR